MKAVRFDQFHSSSIVNPIDRLSKKLNMMGLGEELVQINMVRQLLTTSHININVSLIVFLIRHLATMFVII